jgi:hypothetical protein
MQAPRDSGPVWAPDIDILDTLHGEIIEIPSSSSYELSLFSSKVGSVHDAGGGVSPGDSSSFSIGDLWPEINSSKGGIVAMTCSSLGALSSRPLPGEEARRETLIHSGA